jgi:hypothetical protein
VRVKAINTAGETAYTSPVNILTDDVDDSLDIAPPEGVTYSREDESISFKVCCLFCL